MNTRICILVMAAVLPLCFASCGKENGNGGEDQALMMTPEMLVKFVSATGNNMADGLGIFGNDTNDCFSEITADDDLMKISCTRESDGKEVWAGEKFMQGEIVSLQIFNSFWYRPAAGHSCENEGILLQLGWADFVASDVYWDHWDRPEYYDESYTFRLWSPRLFGSDEPHTIKWFVHIIRNHYEAYRCEVDGVEFPFTDSPSYKEFIQRSMPYMNYREEPLHTLSYSNTIVPVVVSSD